ncbi:MAG: 2-oxoglutarate dehydrogenase complex dihydrolipoyllysine-residue succinyltransferase, partial [Caldilineaceae bacterium]|nr:2-oxoglutarate dehydrogenase complex dihydrolipoyllysine-residue succinyltransferase [Caldilineaceae bacterium]
MPTKIIVPALGESVVEATVARWLKNEGDTVKAGEAVVELETDKVDLEVPAEKDGVLSKIARQAGEDVQIGDLLGTIEEGAGAAAADSDAPAADTAAAAQAESAAKPEPKAPEPAKEEKATPVAKRMAAEQGVDISAVSGAGPGGRVTKQDVKQFMESQPASQRVSQSDGGTVGRSDGEPVGDPRGETRERMSRRRRTIAERLVQAQQTAAMLTTFNEVDMTAVMELRKQYQDVFVKKHGIKLGFMSFFVKAAIQALKEFPAVNAEINGDDIIYKNYYDISVAVSTPQGLVVPVIRDADQMNMAEIEAKIVDLGTRAKDGKLSMDEMTGGTFTITNGGIFGSMMSTPILNTPQSGILGMHNIVQRPMVMKDGSIQARPMMYLALS